MQYHEYDADGEMLENNVHSAAMIAAALIFLLFILSPSVCFSLLFFGTNDVLAVRKYSFSGNI